MQSPDVVIPPVKTLRDPLEGHVQQRSQDEDLALGRRKALHLPDEAAFQEPTHRVLYLLGLSLLVSDDLAGALYRIWYEGR